MNIREAIIKIVEDGQNFEIYSKICTIDSIDKELNTCEVSPVDGDAELIDVKLIATEEAQNGFIIYPAIDSVVIVTFIDKDTAFLSMSTDIDEIVYNGGNNGGLINIETIKAELNKNNAILNAIKDGFNNFIPVVNDGGAALKTLMTGVLSSLPVGDFSAMEDEKFKH